MISTFLQQKISHYLGLGNEEEPLSEFWFSDAFEMIVGRRAQNFSDAELLELFHVGVNGTEAYLRAQAIDLLSFCRTRETTEILKGLVFSGGGDEDFDVSLIAELVERQGVGCEFFLPFIAKPGPKLVRQLAARAMILIRDVPLREQILELYHLEEDVLVKLNYATILGLLDREAGTENLEMCKYVRDCLTFEDADVSREAAECFSLLFADNQQERIVLHSHSVESLGGGSGT